MALQYELHSVNDIPTCIKRLPEFFDIPEYPSNTVDPYFTQTSLLHLINTRLYYERNVVSLTPVYTYLCDMREGQKMIISRSTVV